jgi:hypothetical protein
MGERRISDHIISWPGNSVNTELHLLGNEVIHDFPLQAVIANNTKPHALVSGEGRFPFISLHQTWFILLPYLIEVYCPI